MKNDQTYKELNQIPKHLYRYSKPTITGYTNLKLELEQSLVDYQQMLDESTVDMVGEWSMRIRCVKENLDKLELMVKEGFFAPIDDNGVFLCWVDLEQYHKDQIEKSERIIDQNNKFLKDDIAFPKTQEVQQKLLDENRTHEKYKNYHTQQMYGTRQQSKTKMTQSLPIRKLGQNQTTNLKDIV